MPVYLFTYHAYMSWLPDRSRGYVRRERGVLPPDERDAQWYRSQARESPVTFDASIQQLMIDELLVAAGYQRCRIHAVATDASHLHVVVSWTDERDELRLRTGLRTSITRRLNNAREKRTWLAENASRKRVRDQDHFDHLVGKYLPDHRGVKYDEHRGVYE